MDEGAICLVIGFVILASARVRDQGSPQAVQNDSRWGVHCLFIGAAFLVFDLLTSN